MTEKTLADKLFDAQLEMLGCEGQVETALLKLVGEDDIPFKQIIFDYYDGSIMFKGCDDAWEPPAAVLAKLTEFGFSLCWVDRAVSLGERGRLTHHVLALTPEQKEAEAKAWSEAEDVRWRQACLELEEQTRLHREQENAISSAEGEQRARAEFARLKARFEPDQ